MPRGTVKDISFTGVNAKNPWCTAASQRDGVFFACPQHPQQRHKKACLAGVGAFYLHSVCMWTA